MTEAEKRAVKQAEADGYDLVGNLMVFEDGELGKDGAIALFQRLIDSGLVWQLQGHYGRQAAALIENGICHERKEPK